MNKKIKIIIVLLLSIVLSKLFIDNVFLAQSPMIRQNLGQYLVAKLNFGTKIRNYLSSIKTTFIPSQSSGSQKNQIALQQSPTVLPDNNYLKPISKGVYAVEDGQGNIKKVEFKLGEMEWVEYTFYIRGKEIKVKMPKDQQPPSQSILDKMY